MANRETKEDNVIEMRFLIGIGIVLAIVTGAIGLDAGAAARAEQPDWQKALYLRSDALDREYRLGKYARGTVNTSVGSNLLKQKVTVRISGGKRTPGPDVTNGGVAGTSYFTASGAITDKGTVTTYRTVKGPLITLDFVSVGKKGTITFVVKIDTTRGTSRWTIAAGTKAYKGLRGNGTERENASYTVSTLTGTVSR